MIKKNVKRIYVGMDVHKNSYSLCCYDKDSGEFFGEVKIDPLVEQIEDYLKNIENYLIEKDVQKEIEFQLCYEAGFSGVTLQKKLELKGIDCKIVAPTTLSKDACAKIKKTDRKDARMLATNLAYGTCSFAFVADDIDQETKDFVRLIKDEKAELRRTKQHIHAFVLRHDLRYKMPEDHKRYWTNAHRKWLKELKLSKEDRNTLDEYLDSLAYLEDKIGRLETHALEIANTDKYKEATQNLGCFKGVTQQGALTIVSEIGDFNRFLNPKQLFSYLGLVPGERSSGDKVNKLGITKAGNPVVRNQLVEVCRSLANGFPGKKNKDLLKRQKGININIISYCDRCSDRLIHRYRDLIKRGVKDNKAIIAIARELAGDIWAVMTNHMEPRKIGRTNP